MKQQRRICIYNITQYLANIFCLCRIRLTLGSIDFLPRPGSARQLTSEASRGDAPKTCIKLSAHNQMGYGEKRDIDISYTGIYGFHLSCAFSAASLLFNLKRNFCLVPAPRGSRFLRKPAPCGRGGCAAPLASLGGIEVFVPARRRGTLHPPRTPVSGAMAVGLKKKLGFDAWRPHQISPCTSSARLALPAEARALRARRLLRPARRARGLYEGFCLIDAGQKYTPQYYSSMEKTLPFTSRRTAVSAISLAL